MTRRLGAWLAAHWDQVLVLLLIAAGVVFRASAYGDLRLSVANSETPGYIESSRAPVLSWEIFAGKRLLTTNLLYKLANDAINCPILALSNPAEGKEVPLQIQPCFDRIVLIQNAVSILAWSFLVITMMRRLRSRTARLLMAPLILGFAFTPQVAEWDPILSPESLSVSLWIASLALLIELSAKPAAGAQWRIADTQTKWLIVWLVTFGLWLYLRDAHIYVVIVSIPIIVLILGWKDAAARKSAIVSAALLALLFIVGYLSARDSLRATRYPLVHAFEDYILPYPSRVSFLVERGMPEPGSAAYMPWLDRNASSAYGIFLLAHPGFVGMTLWDNIEYFGEEFTQQYTRGEHTLNRPAALKIGRMLHPESNAVYVMIFILATALLARATQKYDAWTAQWIWPATWLLSGAVIVLLVSFFGDTNAYRRHLYPAVEILRFSMWFLLIVLTDGVLRTGDDRTAASASTGAADRGETPPLSEPESP